ncbi:TPA: type 1 fimbrial protein [Yersinia enterocolitica]|nr:type 1 fimbrial protein [Yersinia enterocolitica]
MNYLNIRPNTLPKKNRFIWLFFIAASLYSLLSATAHAANCSNSSSSLPRDISLTYHPNKIATPAVELVKHRITCEITKNDDELSVYVDSKINSIGLKNNNKEVLLGYDGLSLEYVESFRTTDNRCTKRKDVSLYRYSCHFKNNTSSEIINFEYTLEIKALKALNIPVSREVKFYLYSIVHYGMLGANSTGAFSANSIGGVSINMKITSIPASCSLNTSNINFYLGEQKLTYFTHIGSTNGGSNKKRIELSCPPDTKYFLQIDGIAEPNHPGVIKLTQEPGAASGVGVQLRTGKNNEPVVFGQAKEMGTSATSGTNLQQSIDIEAYHYQTENKVTPGSTNASATFTLTYQ